MYRCMYAHTFTCTDALCIHIFTCTDACMYAHTFTQSSVACQRCPSFGHPVLGLTAPPGMLAQLLRMAQSGPESQSFPWRVQQTLVTLVTSAVTFSHLQLWPRGQQPVSQPSFLLLGRPFIYLCSNENKLGFSHPPK